MVSSKTYREVSAFEQTVQVGDRVRVRFTDLGHFSATGYVTRMSAQSFTVTLDGDVFSGVRAATGRTIRVPRLLNKSNGWSANNRIAPLEA